MTITQKDLAKMAGVAESTVSRALNDKPGVSRETREEILKLAEEHDYRPNLMARGLAREKTHMLALLLPDLKKPRHLQIVEAVERTFESTSHQVVVCNTRRSREKAADYLDLLKYNQFAGALIVGDIPAENKLLQLGWNEKNNLVLLNILLEEMALPCHLVNYRLEGWLAAEELTLSDSITSNSPEKDAERGPVIMLMGSEMNYIEDERREGFVSYCRENGITTFSVCSDISSREDGYEAFLEAADEHYPLPKGFYLTSNLPAAGLMEAIKRGGYMIPEDFQVVGTGRDYIADLVSPELTVVDENIQEIAGDAAQTLLKIVREEEGKDALEKLIKVYDPELRPGETTL